jgi:hypothetical protein
MSVDQKQALQLVLRLTNLKRLPALKWMNVDQKQALRLVLRLTNLKRLPALKWTPASPQSSSATSAQGHQSETGK